MTYPDCNPFKTSGIFLAITYTPPPKLEPQAKPQDEPSCNKRDKEPLYQPPNPTIGASSNLPDMNMLAIDPDLPNPISSFLKNLTLENPRDPFVLLVIDAINLDLSDLGLEEVFLIDDQPTVEEDDVLCLKLPPPPLPIFPPPSFIRDNHTRLTYPSTTDSKHLFTIDNVPPSRWHDGFFNMVHY